MVTNPIRPADRAQLLIIGAIGMVIFLVVLALALNTAVYGEVYVPQSDVNTDEEREIVRMHDAVERAVVGVTPTGPVEATDFDELTEAIHEDMAVWTETKSGVAAENGVALQVNVVEVGFDSHIIQNESGPFTNHNGMETPWTLAETVDEIHRFEMSLESDSLEPNESCPDDSCFEIHITGDNGDTWRMNASTTNATEEILVEVELSDGSTETCDTTDMEAALNLTAGTFVNQDGTCSFTSFADDPGVTAPYTVEYVNPANASGTYQLSTSGKVVADTIEEDDRYDINASPRVDPEVVGVTMDVDIRTLTVGHHVILQIEAGEPDE